jgi:ppGpp synthetase/RelA/SpoT-type nucleotidyltranferase
MGETADRWLAHFAQYHDDYDEAAKIAATIISDALASRQIPIHSIVGRAKSVSAAAQKIGRKAL